MFEKCVQVSQNPSILRGAKTYPLDFQELKS